MEPLRHVVDPLALLIVAGGPVPLCLALVGSRAGRSRGAAEAWLALLTTWCAVELGIVMLLGIAGIFRGPVVLAIEIALAAGGSALLTRRGISPGEAFRSLAIREPLSGAERAVVASTALVGIVFLARLAARPIVDFDSLWYHLPNMAVWYRTGSFVMMDGTGRPVFEQVLRYPYGWEALSTLFLFPFRSDFFVSVPKLVSWAMLGLAVHGLAVRLGARRLHALAAASLTVTVPFVLFDLNTMRIDIPFAAFFVTATWYGLAWAADRSPRDLVLTIVSLGLLVGAKMTGLPYAALIALGVAGIGWRRRRGPGPSFAGSGGLVALAVGFALLAGGFWYLRNWIEIGNPLGLVRVDLGGRTLFPGEITGEMVRRTSLASIFDAGNLDHWRTFLTQIAVRLQLPFACLAVQACFVPRALAASRGDARRALLLVVLFLAGVSGVLYWTHNGSGTPGFAPGTLSPFVGQGFRYAFGFVALLAVIAAVSASGAGTGPRLTVAAVWAGAFTGVLSGTMSEAIKTASFLGSGPEWASGLLHRLGSAPASALAELAGALRGHFGEVLLPALVWAMGATILARFGLPRLDRWRGIVLAAMLLIAIGLARGQRDAARRVVYGGVPEWISANVEPDEVVGYVFSVYSYLFHGKDLRTEVAYVPATTEDEAGWLRLLRARGVSVVALGPNMGARRPLDEIAADVRELRWLEREGSGWERVLGENLSVTPWLWRRHAP